MARLLLVCLLLAVLQGALGHNRRLLQTNLITNGGFEQPGTSLLILANQSFLTLPAGSEAIPGWQITTGNIDYVYNSVWEAVNSNFSVDVAGNDPGGIAQTINTVAGQVYTLTFDLAGSTGGTPVKQLQVQAGNVTTVAEFDITGKSVSNLGYVTINIPFQALANTTTITFTALNPGQDGPIIDNVSVLGGDIGASPLGNTGPVSAPATSNTIYTGGPAIAPASPVAAHVTAPSPAPGPGAALGPNSIVGQIILNRDFQTVNQNQDQLQAALNSDLGTPSSSPQIVSLVPGPTPGTTAVTFTMAPTNPNVPIPQDEINNLRQAFETLLTGEDTLALPTSTLGTAGPFSVVQFPGGVYNYAQAPGVAPSPAALTGAALTSTPLVSFVLDRNQSDVLANQEALKAQLASALGLKPSEAIALATTPVPANTTGDPNVGDTAVTASLITVGAFANSAARLAEIQNNLSSAAFGSPPLGLDSGIFGAPGGVQPLLTSSSAGPDFSFVLDRNIAAVQNNSAQLQSQLAQNLGLANGETVNLTFAALPATTVGNATVGDTLVNGTLVLPAGEAAGRSAQIIGVALNSIGNGSFVLDPTLFGPPQQLAVSKAYTNSSQFATFVLDKPVSQVAANQAELNKELTRAIGVPGSAVVTSLQAVPGNTTGDPNVGDTLVTATEIITPGGPISSATIATGLQSFAPKLRNGTLGLNTTLFGTPGNIILPSTYATTTPLLGFSLNQSLPAVAASSPALNSQLAQTLGLGGLEAVVTSLGNSGANGTNVTANVVTFGGPLSQARLAAIAGNLTSAVNNGTLGLNSAIFGTPSNLSAAPVLQSRGVNFAPGVLAPGGIPIIQQPTGTAAPGTSSSSSTTGNGTATVPASGAAGLQAMSGVFAVGLLVTAVLAL